MKIAIAGVGGRMGAMLVRRIAAAEGCVLSGGLEAEAHPALGRDLGELAGLAAQGVTAVADADTAFRGAEAVIDFSTAAAVAENAAAAARAGAALVVGATGMDAAQQAAIDRAAAEIPVVQAGNMSLGVNLLAQVTRRAAAALGLDWDVEIVESHHRWKLDAPSGTALMLGRAVAEGRGQDHDAVAVGGRHGVGAPRAKGEIGYAALRGGNVVGEHQVIFATDDERVILGHTATDRAIFAAGAVRAAEWARGRPAGHYRMADVLGLEED